MKKISADYLDIYRKCKGGYKSLGLSIGEEEEEIISLPYSDEIVFRLYIDGCLKDSVDVGLTEEKFTGLLESGNPLFRTIKYLKAEEDEDILRENYYIADMLVAREILLSSAVRYVFDIDEDNNELLKVHRKYTCQCVRKDKKSA